MDDSSKSQKIRVLTRSELLRDLINSEGEDVTGPKAVHSWLELIYTYYDLISTFEDFDFNWMVNMRAQMEEDLFSLFVKYVKIVSQKYFEMDSCK